MRIIAERSPCVNSSAVPSAVPYTPIGPDDPVQRVGDLPWDLAREPLDGPDDDAPEPVDGDSLEFWAGVDRPDWWRELGSDLLTFADDSASDDDDDDREAWEHETIDGYLRRREAEGAADEYRRWGGHPG